MHLKQAIKSSKAIFQDVLGFKLEMAVPEDKNGIETELNKNKKAEIAKKLGTAWYGMQEFYIKDCNGYILGFAERK